MCFELALEDREEEPEEEERPGARRHVSSGEALASAVEGEGYSRGPHTPGRFVQGLCCSAKSAYISLSMWSQRLGRLALRFVGDPLLWRGC